MGPLLVLCYLQKIALSLTHIPQQKCLLIRYADDANLKVSAKTVDEMEMLSYTELLNISDYLKHHNLKINAAKTNYIVFKRFKTK